MATQWDTRPTTATPREQYPASHAAGTSNGHGREASDGGERLARSLGWFSIGLGLAEVLAPRQIAKITGTRNHTGWIRAFGVREIVSGIGILSSPRPANWVWSRVGGDVLDLATLGAAMASPETNVGKTALSVAAVAGVTALDVLCAQQVSAASGYSAGAANRLEANLMISRSPEECYRLWRDFEQLPRFMSYLQSVRDLGAGRSHWVALAPADTRLEWDAEIVNDTPGQVISWRSLPGSEVDTSGSVEFEAAPGGRGTIVRVQMDFAGRGQALAWLGRLFGKHPEQMVYKDLRRFKQVVETGEAITTEGQSAGRTGSTTWLDSIAR